MRTWATAITATPPRAHYTRCTESKLFKALGAAVYAVDANLIDVEVDCSGVITDKDNFHAVGLPDATVRESRDRITINLAPADIKKGGSSFDLPIALGILGAYGALQVSDVSRFFIVGKRDLVAACVPCPACCPS